MEKTDENMVSLCEGENRNDESQNYVKKVREELENNGSQIITNSEVDLVSSFEKGMCCLRLVTAKMALKRCMMDS